MPCPPRSPFRRGVRAPPPLRNSYLYVRDSPCSALVPESTPACSSHLETKLTNQLAGLSTFGGIMGYTMAGSVPSLAGGLGVGSVMAVAAMRIHDGLPYGYELAAASSGGLAIPMIK